MKMEKQEKRCETCRAFRRRERGDWFCFHHRFLKIYEPEYTGCNLHKPKEELNAVRSTE